MTPIVFLAQGVETDLSCVEKFEIPTYDPLLRNSNITGTVRIRARVGADGGAESIELDGTMGRLQEVFPIRLGPIAFHSECAGKFVEINLDYHFEGEPTERSSLVHVRITGPNSFEITVPPPILIPEV